MSDVIHNISVSNGMISTSNGSWKLDTITAVRLSTQTSAFMRMFAFIVPLSAVLMHAAHGITVIPSFREIIVLGIYFSVLAGLALCFGGMTVAVKITTNGSELVVWQKGVVGFQFAQAKSTGQEVLDFITKALQQTISNPTPQSR